MTIRSANLNVMTAAARKAARSMLRDFGEIENLQVSLKGTRDFVSSADLRAEKTLRLELQKARPAYGFLLEEGGEIIGNDYSHRWIIDPIDGTTNFLHGLPYFSISIALERDGEVIAGVVYHPISDEMYYAEKGAGAFVNERRLRVSARKSLEESVVSTGFMARGDLDRFIRQFSAVMSQVAGVRRFGSAALDLAYVAAGRLEGYWEEHLYPWDIAAGVLLVKESGGYMSDTSGGQEIFQTGSILASNPYLHQALGALIKGAND